MAKVEFILNGQARTFEGDPETPLLWVIRENCGLTGTKFGCGMALCGACTVHITGTIDGDAVTNLPIRSCVKRISDVEGMSVRTIEGLAAGGEYHPIQKAWVNINVPQCGYCQSGQIMAAVALAETMRAQKRVPTDEEINMAMSGNLCRCGTYPRIKEAIKEAVSEIVGAK